MTEIEWQLIMDGISIKPGTMLEMQDRWLSNETVFCRITQQNVSNSIGTESGAAREAATESGAAVSETFIVRSNVCIGGKIYLLLESGSRTYVVRLLETNRLCAMDPDRFSSLRNALNLFREANAQTQLDEFERLLGTLRIVPPATQ